MLTTDPCGHCEDKHIEAALSGPITMLVYLIKAHEMHYVTACPRSDSDTNVGVCVYSRGCPWTAAESKVSHQRRAYRSSGSLESV